MKYYYVYLLLLDEIPVYVGFTYNPVSRFRYHYRSCSDCSTVFILKHLYFIKNKIVKMKLVFCSDTERKTRDMELVAIRALVTAGFNLINKKPPKRFYPFEKIEDRKMKVPKTIYHIKNLTYLIENQQQILKEYGYKTN